MEKSPTHLDVAVHALNLAVGSRREDDIEQRSAQQNLEDADMYFTWLESKRDTDAEAQKASSSRSDD